ncbi:MAG: hypothetical protein QM741_18580 [Rudaea sp.]|uniref:hypothetical protein n=1 Tax=Rudaea sp. TaxID=2136325 RepID=UPI0039E49CD6
MSDWKQVPNELAELAKNPPAGCVPLLVDGEVKIIAKTHLNAALELAFKAAMRIAMAELGIDDFTDFDGNVSEDMQRFAVTVHARDGRQATASAPIQLDGKPN